MISNLIKIALRHHAKNKVYAFINILGLAIGMACFGLLTLLVRDELSHDTYHRDKDLIYQVYTWFEDKSEADYAGLLMAPAGPLFAEVIPEVESFTRFKASANLLAQANGNRIVVPRMYATDAATLAFFDLSFLNANIESLKLNKNEIILSKSTAERLYGTAENAIDKVFEIIDFNQFVVKAVFEDLPDNSHLAFDYVISFEHVAELAFFETGYDFNFVGWSLNGYPTYLRVKEPIADLTLLESKIQAALEPHVGERNVRLIPLDEVYFSEFNRGFFKAVGDDSYHNLYLFIGFILLTVAVVNYTNLSTARFSRRAREVGIRKAIGGYRSQLITQFLAESVTLATISSILAICIFELIVPSFNGYMGKSIGVDYSSISTYVGFIGFTLFVGGIAGIYPSLFLSAFSPQQGLTNGVRGNGNGLFRKMLVGFQFATCLALMTIAVVVYNQHDHLSKLDTGLNKDQVVVLPLKDKNLQKSYQSFKNELSGSSQVRGVAGASIDLFSREFIIKTDVEGQEDMLITWVRAEANFFELLEIEKEQGVLFSEQQGSERQGKVVINQAAIRATGWEQPLEQKLLESQVTGVVKDFIYGSAKEVIAPLMVTEGREGDFECAYIRISGNIPAAIESIENTFNQFSKDHPFEYKFLDDEFAAKYESERRLGKAFAAFSLLTIFIAGLGVLGLSIFIAETRTKEIGIRKVLGAGIERIVWLLNGGITLLILGVAVVTLPVVYYFLNDWLQGFASRVDLSILYFLVPLLSLLAVVWAILLYQALKSARLNPVEALRSE